MTTSAIPGKVAFLFPGQGSQQVGMGRALAEHFPVARQAFEEADDALGFALSKLCFEGPAEILTDTANAQPAILAASIASMRALEAATSGEVTPSFVAGHSLGEYTALVASGVLSYPCALRLVRLRGELMRRAGQASPGGMAALIGLDSPAVEDICARAASGGGVVQVANDNAPGQVVISGDRATLDKAMELAKTSGARRVVPLPVSIAAHSRLMERAAEGLRHAIGAAALHLPRIRVVGNVDAQPLGDIDSVKNELVKQLTSPVRWTDTVRYLAREGVTRFVEVGPGNVLAGLVKRISENAIVTSIGDLASIQALVQAWGLKGATI
jgi:[acyl-carrier-protein] S-malonyltransferase